ncbi:MAG: PEP-CTERM sorting domain-containing protein [Cyanobacteria bacterium P01_A01_bin.123]
MNQSTFIKSCSIAIAAAGAVALAAPVQAQTVLNGYTTGGDDMDGMRILVEFLNGTSQEAIWGTTGTNTGGAFGTDWGLTFSNSTTFGNSWTFNANNSLGISSLTIDAVPGNTVFDDGNGISTPGSAGGWAFEVTSGTGPDAWDYSNPIDISTGDLWGTLSMSWDAGFTGTMKFIADTDNGTINNPVTSVAADVPEPGTAIALLGIAALGAGSTRKLKQSQSA